MPEAWESTDTATTFRIGDGPSESGARLGGAPPSGVHPRGALRYFVTVPVGSGQFASVFADTSVEFIFGDSYKRVLGPVCPGLEVIIHEASDRSSVATKWDSGLTPHPLIVGACVQDEEWDEHGQVVRYSGHKFGGQPYIIDLGEPLELEVRDLFAAGFRQLLQIDFPTGEDGDVAGTWPFGDGMFHVLVKPAARSYEWRCFWQG